MTLKKIVYTKHVEAPTVDKCIEKAEELIELELYEHNHYVANKEFFATTREDKTIVRAVITFYEKITIAGGK